MERAPKPYVQISIDDVDTVIHDPNARYSADLYDRFATFEQARDAAISCIEDVLEEGDYESEQTRSRLEFMRGLLELSQTWEDLEAQPEYRRFLKKRRGTSRTVAA